MNKKRLLSIVVCFVMSFAGIPFSAEEASKDVSLSRNQDVFQQADTNEIQFSFYGE